jgi:hypothetical protein
MHEISVRVEGAQAPAEKKGCFRSVTPVNQYPFPFCADREIRESYQNPWSASPISTEAGIVAGNSLSRDPLQCSLPHHQRVDARCFSRSTST